MNKPSVFGLVIVLAGALAGCGQTVEVQTAGYGQAGGPTVALSTYPEEPVAAAPFRISTEVGDDPTPEELAEDALTQDPGLYDRINALPVGDPNVLSPYFSTTTSSTSTSTTTTTSTTTSTTTLPTTTTSTTTTPTTVAACTFTGFFSPVDNTPVVNVVKAGAAVPVKFGFCQSGTLAIFATGSPSSAPHACGSGPSDEIESTVAVSSSGLSFDAATGRYQYNWKTDGAWVGQCRTLSLRFATGPVQTAEFRFR